MFRFVLLCIVCYFGMCSGCPDDERAALQEIMDSMGYQSEFSLPESYTDDCCQWEGVKCSLTSSHVVRLFFYCIREEQELWYPDMTPFAKIKELQELDLRGNHIGGLVNQQALCELVNLQRLDLSDNSIEDNLHPCFSNMTSLRILNLSKNRFQGDLFIFQNLSEIEEIDVSHNLFQGLIPLSIFANLSKLSYLDISYNRLEVESESPSWHPSFQIQHLFLAGCNLNHASDGLIPHFIFTQRSLQTLDLSYNFLQGYFPDSLLYHVSSVLRLRGNLFVGQFPHVHQNKESTLVDLDISCNFFDGSLPSNISLFLPHLSRFNASSNLFVGTIPASLGELPSLEHLDLSNNNFSGFIPGSVTKNSPLWYLNLSNNSLSGMLLPENCNMRQLRWLLLHSNLFIGNLPACLSNSSSLLLLDVRHNYLSRIISRQMQVLFELRMLTRQVQVFSELGALLLGGNHFTGHIPMQLCQMTMLQFLDLSNSSLSGPIPSCLGRNLFWRMKLQATSWVPIDFTTKGNSYSFQGIPLTLMTAIDLSVNKLSGFIPVQLGELQQLHSLNLSHNLLTGHFPASFKNLMNLESLDLSHNKLTGQIPLEIVHMSTLAYFSVAFNDLSGRIPFFDQLSTFSEASYIGNPKLCGQPLEIECSDTPTHSRDNDEEENNHMGEEEEECRVIDEPLIFYSFVFMSYALGFWSVIAPLCINENWRRKYYATIDRWWMNCYE